jgi:hypothetical protein
LSWEFDLRKVGVRQRSWGQASHRGNPSTASASTHEFGRSVCLHTIGVTVEIRLFGDDRKMTH